MIGQRLLHYEISEMLGEGGMGVVYKARDTHLDRFVAIKVLPPEKTADSARKARFVQEAKAASALNHPNIITIHDISTDSGVDFIAMEYVDGKTLDQMIPRKGMRLNEALKLAVQIADALARAYGAGIIHRDLKPVNIMVDAHGQAKVLDFGLAKLTERGISEDDSTATLPVATSEGTIVGTAAYMSPEQAEGKLVDARTDIFSFGCLLYEMLAGHRPFSGDSQLSTIGAILHKDPAPLGPDVPYDLARMVLQCLRKDPQRRYQHMDDLKVVLLGVVEESESGKLAGPLPAPRRAGRLGAWWVKAALILIALVGVLWIAWYSRQTAEMPLAITPLTTYSGNEMSPAFSPDAKQIAFLWDGENWTSGELWGRSDIYLKLIGSSNHVRLTNSADAGAPLWSPDSSTILFARSRGGRIVFSSMSALGGPQRVVREIEGTLGRGLFCPPAAWMPDSRRVVFFDGQILAPDTGELRRLWSLPTSQTSSADGCIAVSPDGRTIAFTRFTGQVDGEIYTLRIDADAQPSGEPRRLTHLNRLAYNPAFTADGKEILFVHRRAFLGSGSVYRVPVSGGSEPRIVPVGQGVAYQVATSSRADRFVFVQHNSNTNIFRLPLEAQGRAAAGAVPLITSSRLDYEPEYSPDGSQIAFVSDRGGQVGIWKCKVDGSEQIELFSRSGGHADGPTWSPDGSRIAFSYAGSAARDIWGVPSQGGTPKRLTDHPADDLGARFSRDGKWIYFGSSRSGEYQVWKTPAGGGAAVQVTRRGGAGGIESPDGSWVYYFKGFAVYRVPAGGGEETEVLPVARNYYFLVVENGVYFLSMSVDSGEYAVQFKDIQTGSVRTIAHLGTRIGYGLALSPGRRDLLFVKEEGEGRDLMLVENFR